MNTRDSGDMLKSVFDAMPSMVFVVDDEVRIQEHNAAAGELLLKERTAIIKRGVLLSLKLLKPFHEKATLDWLPFSAYKKA